MGQNFQRKNSLSNASEGLRFELTVQSYFNRTYGLDLKRNVKIDISASSAGVKKARTFDLGKENEIIIECKSHNWTEGNNVPSAKLSVWNEAMYFFHLAPKELRKLFVVERFFSNKRNLSLAQYYIQNHEHLIPDCVEIWEYDPQNGIAQMVMCLFVNKKHGPSARMVHVFYTII